MNLLSVQGTGAIAVIVLFFICLVIVHVTKLALLGYRAARRKKAPPEPQPTTPPEPAAEPIYYIVEKKKKRVKSEYSDPKRISFK